MTPGPDLLDAEVKALSARNAELAALNRVAEAAAAAPDLDAFLARASEEVAALLSADVIWFFLVDRQRREAKLLHLHGGGEADRAAFARFPLLGTTVGTVALDGVTVVRDVSELSEGSREALERMRLATVVSAPLRFRSSVVGVVSAGFRERREAATCRTDLLQGLAAHFAAAIQTQTLVGDLGLQLGAAADNARRAEELGLVLEVGRSLVATLELDQVLDAGVRNLARIVDAPDAYLLLADASGTHLSVRAAAGSRPELVGTLQSLEDDQGVAPWVFRRRSPLVVEDAIDDPRVNKRLQAASGARAYLGVPLVVRDRAIGTALIAETRGPRRFTGAEVERATAIANQLAVAVENARLYEDLRRSYADLAYAQDQLVRQERLAALGELAAVVAHEVRNPLGVIFNSLGSLRRLLRPKGDAKMLLEMMGEEADRLNRIVGDLLDFAKPTPALLRPEPLDRVVDEAVAAALAAAGPRVALSREVPAGLPPVPMDARLIRQAVLNVAANAVQAMPEGGTLTVRARVEGGAATIEIADTGPGIPREVRERIFEPFFTTKATGTGLGLAVVKRIVDDHGGQVEVRPVPGGGTVFALRLPLAPPPDSRLEPRRRLG